MTQLELLAYTVLFFTGITALCAILYLIFYHLFLADDPNWQAIVKHLRR